MKITPLWHLAVGNELAPKDFNRVRRICREHGGLYMSRISLPANGINIPPGFAFLTQEKAEEAKREIKEGAVLPPS